MFENRLTRVCHRFSRPKSPGPLIDPLKYNPMRTTARPMMTNEDGPHLDRL